MNDSSRWTMWGGILMLIAFAGLVSSIVIRESSSESRSRRWATYGQVDSLRTEIRALHEGRTP